MAEHITAAAKIAGAALAAAGGIGLAAQSRINGQLGATLHDGMLAALCSFVVGMVLLMVMVAGSGRARAGVGRLRTALGTGALRWWHCLGGACGAFLVAGQGITISALGVAVFTIAVVAGQVTSGLAVDRAGIGPGGPRPITQARAAGALIAVVAVVVSVLGDFTRPAALSLAIMPALAGIGLAFQQAVNGQVRVASANVVVPTAVNFGAGTAVLLAAGVVDVIVRGLPGPLPGQWWLYLGGPIGILVIIAAVIAVRLTGVLLLGLCTVAGQLVGAIVLDTVVPAGGELTGTSVLGALITLVAVGVAALPSRAERSARMAG